jgi:hypothetical protein
MSAFLLSENVSKIRLLTIWVPSPFFLFLNPLVDFRGRNSTSYRLMRAQGARSDLSSI